MRLDGVPNERQTVLSPSEAVIATGGVEYVMRCRGVLLLRSRLVLNRKEKGRRIQLGLCHASAEISEKGRPPPALQNRSSRPRKS